MQRTLRPALVALALILPALARADDPKPQVAEGWTIDLIAQAPAIVFPTAVVVAPDGTIYLGQDPMDMPGPPSHPIDSVVAIKDGKVTTFADKLHAVMGLEWIDGTLYVVHAPFLSAFTDTDGDGRADRRVDLMTGLGPANPAFSGMNDHIASGVRLGMDGFLYIAVGDKGIPKGVGKDGTTIRMKGGGVIRIRPDGTELEIVSTGERNPLSVALTDRDDIFTYGNDDDSHRWPNSLTHHIVGGHYGYPYEFLTAPWRCLPIVQGQIGGAGAQAIVYNEDGLAPKYWGNLLACEWGLQAIFRYELVKSGVTFKVARREPLVTKGTLGDFRPFSLAVDADRNGLILVDWAYNGWLADGTKTGRLYRLRYEGKDKVSPSNDPCGFMASAKVLDELNHPARSVRLAAQRKVAAEGASRESFLPGLIARKPDPRVEGDRFENGRVHALWALDAINTPSARAAIRESLSHASNAVRLQAIRSVGIRRDSAAAPAVAKLLGDLDPAVRREAAIALGRIGDKSTAPALYDALGTTDRFVAWSVRTALRKVGAWDADAIRAALRDPKRRDNVLALVDESWSPAAIEGLIAAYGEQADPTARARILANLAGQYRRYPEWSGAWFGTNPLAGAFPAKTVDWDKQAMGRILVGLARGLVDPEASVRRQAIVGMASVGPEVATYFLAAAPRETDATNRAALVAWLGRWGEPRAVPLLGQIVAAKDQPLALRVAALDALGGINNRQAFNLRFALVFDDSAPPELVARALPGLGRSGALPPNDLADFLEGKPKPVQIAALVALREVAKLPPEVHERIGARLDDPDADVRRAAIEAVARLRLTAAVPRLVAMAKSEETRVEATLALAAMPDPRALATYLAALDDRSPDLRRAGEVALLRIRDKVADELKRRARAGEFTGVSALAVERILSDFRPIDVWRVIGPFPRSTAQVFFGETSIDFARAHAGVEGRPIHWAFRQGEPKTGRVVLDDFKGGRGDFGGFGFDAAGSPDLAAFAYAEIPSDRDRNALLLVGSSGSMTITLNEVPVHSLASGGRAFAPDSDLVRVRLAKGINRLLLKTRQGIGNWTFSVAVSEASEPLFAARPRPTGIEALRAFALGHSGDARKGEDMFFDPKGLNCAKCHSAGGRGESSIGPDLTGLALKYDKAEIVRSVLEPSARIATGYQPAIVAKRDGSIVTGLVRGETATHIELVDGEAKPFRVATSDVADRHVGDVSTMPAGQVDGLAPVDFADLVAYLMSLKAASPR
jgi:putative heme-binding domain-containing protein